MTTRWKRRNAAGEPVFTMQDIISLGPCNPREARALGRVARRKFGRAPWTVTQLLDWAEGESIHRWGRAWLVAHVMARLCPGRLLYALCFHYGWKRAGVEYLRGGHDATRGLAGCVEFNPSSLEPDVREALPEIRRVYSLTWEQAQAEAAEEVSRARR